VWDNDLWAPPFDFMDFLMHLDEEFDEAFGHLSACRIAYEDDPRDPARFAQLASARMMLEDSRKAMEDERARLGLEPPKWAQRNQPNSQTDQLQVRGLWSSIQGSA